MWSNCNSCYRCQRSRPTWTSSPSRSTWCCATRRPSRTRSVMLCASGLSSSPLPTRDVTDDVTDDTHTLRDATVTREYISCWHSVSSRMNHDCCRETKYVTKQLCWTNFILTSCIDIMWPNVVKSSRSWMDTCIVCIIDSMYKADVMVLETQSTSLKSARKINVYWEYMFLVLLFTNCTNIYHIL